MIEHLLFKFEDHYEIIVIGLDKLYMSDIDEMKQQLLCIWLPNWNI